MERPEEISRFRQAAERKDYDITSIFAGESVAMLREERTAGDVIQWLGSGAEQLLRDRTQALLVS